ncbi:MAG: biopolymer transporter ExbD [Rhodobacteraceae bacterium]|nr:biopolymer transporter ExbD [Paracoccaceae bacterium]
MDFAAPPRRRRTENLLPMINVVFLLLIFFLIAATLAPPEPFAVTLPEAATDAAGDAAPDAGFTLHLGTDGRLANADGEGDAALAALAAARVAHCAAVDCASQPPTLLLRADAVAPADRLAPLLASLGAAGFASVTVVTAAP